jgi:hypothetical protein
MIAHPAASLLSHGFDRTDLFLAVYCLVDDWMKQLFGSSNMPRKRRAPRADEITDSEVMTLILVGELCHVKRERAWLRQVRASYLHLFPTLPEDSRFSRRAEAVRNLYRPFRHGLLRWADVDCEPVRLFDTFPMPLCACYRIRQSSLPISGSSFAYNSSKRQYYFGLHPGLLVTGTGFIEDIVLAPGYCSDVMLLSAYLNERINECASQGSDLSHQEWALDKGFFSKPLKQAAKERLGLNLMARQRDYALKEGEQPAFWQQMLDQLRKPIEGIISVLTECFGMEHMLVKTDWGIFRRAEAKATAFSIARYFNHVLNLEPMNIARYAV